MARGKRGVTFGLADVTVVLPAGGKGERLASLLAGRRVNKAALRVGRHSLIERTLTMYARAGHRRFVVLVGHAAGSVRSALGDGRRWGVTVDYAEDPPRPVGKGGAVRLALDRGVIPAGRPFLVHNPDDQIVRIDRAFPGRAWRAHRARVAGGALATAVCVPSTAYPFTAFVAGPRGLARSAVMYPPVERPTHVGVTLFEPAAGRAFDRLIPLNRRTDFESVVLPRLARAGRLGLAMIPSGAWIPVNDLKGYRQLLAALG